MTRRGFALACCCVLLSVATMRAQSGKAEEDPITGTWSGELAPQNAPAPRAVTMKLTFDGKGKVSGTVDGLPNPAEVKSGTFDPKTGALKLELGKTSDSAVLLILDGTVVKGTATGKLSGEGSGEFKITKQR